ncbi:MAG: hypothetical protein KY431_05105, partial [Actinobacteria bacterium]|nr:hypothetical protein [Actinomycetota bacterium]
MLRVGAHDVAALYQADGRPLPWRSYVAVEGAAATAARARGLGATVLQDAFDRPLTPQRWSPLPASAKRI